MSRFRSIKSQINWMGILYIIIIAVIIGNTLFFIYQERQSGFVINMAGRQRMLTQKYVKEIYQFLIERRDSPAELPKEFEKTSSFFRNTLTSLIEGGPIYVNLSGNEFVEIEPTGDKKILAKLRNILTAWKRLEEKAGQVMKNLPDKGKMNDEIKRILIMEQKILAEMNQAVRLYESKNRQRTDRLLLIELIFLVISLLLVVTGYYKGQNISLNLNKLSLVAREIAEGNLVKGNSRSKYEEIILLSQSLDIMVENMREMIGKIGQTVSDLAETSNNYVIQSDLRSGGFTDQFVQQNSAIKQISGIMGNLSDSTETISQNTELLLVKSQESLSLSQSGIKAAKETIQGMEEIRKHSLATNRQVNNLRKQSEAIEEINTIISDIAGQTKYLSLNAAIEATKAGDMGKGFDVVATEIRELAENVVDATDKIKSIIREIQASVGASLKAVTLESHQVEMEISNATSAMNTWQEIVDQAHDSLISLSKIEDKIKDNLSTGDQVAGNLQDISRSNSFLLESVKKIGSSANNLNHLSNELKKILSKYNL